VLDDVIRDAAAHGIRRPSIDPRALVRRIDFDVLGGPDIDALELAAERELVRVHRAELAQLLRTAAGLRACGSPRPSELAAWRGCLREQLDCIAIDGWRVADSVRRVLAKCAGIDLALWPSADDIARAALALHDVEAGRVLLGESLLGESLLAGSPLASDRVREAAAVFADALCRCVHRSNLARLLDGLLQAQVRLGHVDCARRLKARADALRAEVGV
jgi:hypothetical protein